MRSVGSYLRENRESRGITLEEAARVTRIGKNYLTALEEETFDSLPNMAYAKGFLRAYAAFLGLSGDEIVAMYERDGSAPAHHPAAEKADSSRAETGKLKASRRGRWIVSSVLLAMVVMFAYLFGDRETLPEKNSPPVEPLQAARAALPVQPSRSSAQRPADPAGAEIDTAKGEAGPVNALPQGSGIVLRLKVNQDCWLNITIDDAVSQQYDLKEGDLIEWKGERVFALDMGNAGGIEAEFNGKPLKPFGAPGKPAHAVLKADGA